MRLGGPADIAAVQNHESVADVEVRTPSLEEIFAAYMQIETGDVAEESGE